MNLFLVRADIVSGSNGVAKRRRRVEKSGEDDGLVYVVNRQLYKEA